MASALVEIAGLACLVVAAVLVSPVLGWAVCGVSLLLIGQALDGVQVGAVARRTAARLAAKVQGRVRP